MGGSSKALLDLEAEKFPSSSSSLESRLLVCKSNDLLRSRTPKPQPSDGKPSFSSVPKSQFLGKVKDFLGVISEANKKLQSDANDDSKDYNIEELTGNESEYIEMDLMLGVADLHTPEAVAAAESAVSGYQQVIDLNDASSSGTDSSSSDDDDEEEVEVDDEVETQNKRLKPVHEDGLCENKGKGKSKKRPKIVQL